MPLFVPRKVSVSSNTLRRVGLGVAGALAVVALAYGWEPVWTFFTDQARIRAWIAGFGPWAPLAAVVFVALKVLAAPIPGQIVGTVNGYLFGTFWGTVYSLVGMSIGTVIALAIGRYAGRPVVARLVGEKRMQRWDGLARERGLVFFTLIYLLPFTPDDIISYLAGMTSLSLRRVLFWSILARTPGMLVGNWFGSSIPRFTLWQWVLIGLYVAAWVWLTVRYYARMEAAMLRVILWVESRWTRVHARRALAQVEEGNG